MRVFYSWQSDSPQNTNRYLIESALDSAVRELARQGFTDVEVDHSTLGVLGAPPIAATVMKKIDDADVFVADMTLVGHVNLQDKRLLNSNVAIELGYAIARHGHDRLLLVMNSAYGTPGSLPFDLKHLRFPTPYHLEAGAARATRDKETLKLADKLTQILLLYARHSQNLLASFDRRKSTFLPAVYWEEGEPLIRAESNSGVSIKFESQGPFAYFRVSPVTDINRLDPSILTDFTKSGIEPPSIKGHSQWNINHFGNLRYVQEAGIMKAVTQVFDSGEIWAVTNDFVGHEDGISYVIPATVEQSLAKAFAHSLGKIDSVFGYPEQFNLEFGLIGVAGYRLWRGHREFNSHVYQFSSDVQAESIVHRDNRVEAEHALLGFFDKMYSFARSSRKDSNNHHIRAMGYLSV